MPVLAPVPATLSEQSRLDRALSVFAEVRAGEGATAVLMLVNIFLLLVCYSVVKTVREPLILLGGGAEVRSYAAAGQALLLMGFVPLYSWLASRLGRIKLLVGVTLLFILCIELFAAAVAARVPYVGVAFFIWVGIFNISLVAQFWSFANDIYRKPAGDRLFPIIVMGMTAGAPLGSIVSARLFRLGMDPQSILQISVLLLAVSVLLYLWINAREPRHIAASEPPMSSSGGFRLVLNSGYLRLIAALIVLLNIVNTTGEYLISRLLTAHVNQLALLDPGFDGQAFIGAYVGEYQFWVNVTAFILQAFVASRLVKYQGLAGVLLALPLIALGGYAIVALGAGLSLVRWIKTAENAADYSLMNTARQLLWLPTSREEKYKAKQAIDTFFVRAGDVLSAGVVYAGTSVLYLTEAQFAGVNVALTLAWLALAARILHPGRPLVRMPWRRVATASAVVLIAAVAHPASAQETREEQLAAARAEKAEHLHPYRPTPAERWILRAENMLRPDRPVYLFMGSAFEGGGLAAGPGYRAQFADSGVFNAHAGWSARNYKVLDATVDLPALANGRLLVRASGHWLDAPSVAFYGVGNSTRGDRRNYAHRAATVGVSARVEAARGATLGAGVDMIAIDSVDGSPTYRRSRLFAAFDSRPSPAYARRGGLYRIDWSDYRDLRTGGRNSFRRIDAEVDRFIPLLRGNWVIALRAAASSTSARSGDDVPHFLMPDVGGSDTLRGYPARRFRDRHRMILTGEYRWTAGPFVDMALFMDAGKVADRFRDLDLRGLKTSYGIGLTLHTPSRTIARIELARTREGMGVVVSFSPNF